MLALLRCTPNFSRLGEDRPHEIWFAGVTLLGLLPVLIDVMHGTKIIGLTTLFVAGCSCSSEGPNSSGDSTSDSGIVVTATGTESESGSGSGSSDGPRLDVGNPGSTDGDTDGCVDVTVSVDPVIPTLVLLVDQSGSMTANFDGVSRWEATYDTLMDPVDGVVIELEDRVRFGLSLYTSDDGFQGPMCPIMTTVPPALSNHAAIDAVYSLEAPLEDTPTGDAIDVVASELVLFPEPGPKGIVLATDGEPDTCEEPDPQNGQVEAVTAAQNAFTDDIRTYIVSVGDDVSDAHLQEMANAGAGKDPMEMVDPEPFYKALDPQQLVDAFKQIIADFVTCEFTLNGEIIGDPCDGTVRVDGMEIECGTEWDATSPTTIELLGGACDLIKDGEEHTIEVVFPCGSVNIP